MDALIIFFIFAFGTIVGSFLNVVILRKNTGESIIWDSSHCFSCGKKLSARDLIPIFSFLFSKGHCRRCGSKISWQYPIVELLTGILALLVYAKFPISDFQFPITWLFYFAAFCVLLLVAVYDFRQKIIDTHFLYIFSAFTVVQWIVWRAPSIGDFVSSFFIALFFYLMWFVSGGRWMGRGDANLALPLSLFLGWPQNLGALFISFWLGGITGIFLLIFRNKKFGLKSEIPFGPFLVLAGFIAWYYGGIIEGFWIW